MVSLFQARVQTQFSNGNHVSPVPAARMNASKCGKIIGYIEGNSVAGKPGLE